MIRTLTLTLNSVGYLNTCLLSIDAVVFPANSQDVSYTVQATRTTPLGRDYAFVRGGHSLTGASSSYGLVIDLEYLNHTTVLRDFTDPITRLGTTVIMYEGGATSLGLQSNERHRLDSGFSASEYRRDGRILYWTWHRFHV